MGSSPTARTNFTGVRLRLQSVKYAPRRWHGDGYLLHGPPGTGKTSLVRALAGAFDRDLALLNLASDKLDDIKLASLVADVPEHCIIVLEDIDAAFIPFSPTSM